MSVLSLALPCGLKRGAMNAPHQLFCPTSPLPHGLQPCWVLQANGCETVWTAYSLQLLRRGQGCWSISNGHRAVKWMKWEKWVFLSISGTAWIQPPKGHGQLSGRRSEVVGMRSWLHGLPSMPVAGSRYRAAPPCACLWVKLCSKLLARNQSNDAFTFFLIHWGGWAPHSLLSLPWWSW